MTENAFSSSVTADDHIAVVAAKERLIARLQTRPAVVHIETLEMQAEAYRTYRDDYRRCAEACLDLLAEYAGIVRGIGNDESDVDKQTLRDVANDWIDDELSTADDWADEIQDGHAE